MSCTMGNILPTEFKTIIPNEKKNFQVKQNYLTNEPLHDKTNKMTCGWPAKTQISLGIRPVWSVFAITQISLGIRPVWSESSLSAWRNIGPLTTYSAYSQDSDQTGRMPRLIWVFAGRTSFCWFCCVEAQMIRKQYSTNKIDRTNLNCRF